MGETTTAEVFLALCSFFGSTLADLPDRFDDLVRVTLPIVYRQSHMSVEEARLDSFWREYYGAMARFNGDLSKLDWVAFYKNHGLQLTAGDNTINGGSQRIQFAPMVVAPRMEWSVPPGTKLGSTPVKAMAAAYPYGAQPAVYSPPPPPPGYGYSPARSVPQYSYYPAPACPTAMPGAPFAAPPSAMPPLPTMPPPPPADDCPDVPAAISKSCVAPAPLPAAPKAAAASGLPGGLRLQMKLVESPERGTEKAQSWTCPLGVTGAFRTGDAGDVTLTTGTAKDLLPLPNGVLPANVSPIQSASVGTSLTGQVTPISADRVRLDLTLEKSEIESAGKDNVLIAGKSYRLAQQVQLGRSTKVVLRADAAGEPRTWLEVVIRREPPQPMHGAK